MRSARAVALVAMLAGAILLIVSLVALTLSPAPAPPVEDGRPSPPVGIAPPQARPVVETDAQPRARSARLGEGLATMRIPALGADWTYPVIEGIRPQDLDRGMTHYPGTALPGEKGNAAFAGHRWEGPLYDFERLHIGALIHIEQRGASWTYRVTTEPRIIDPTDVWVVDPLPGRMLTLTTCWPKDGSSHREYVRARLIERNPS